MADTMFNIFGDHLLESAPKKNLHTKNTIGSVKKPGAVFKGITPSKINKNIATPNTHDIKKKSFLINEGTSIQMFCPQNKNIQKKLLQTPKNKNLQVYEDENVETESKKGNELQDTTSIEYNKKPMFYEDLEIDDFSLTEEQINKIVLGLPKNDIKPSIIERPSMLPLDGIQDINDILIAPEYDPESESTADISIPFDLIE